MLWGRVPEALFFSRIIIEILAYFHYVKKKKISINFYKTAQLNTLTFVALLRNNANSG